MTQPKPLAQVLDETRAFVRDLVAEAAEVRKHPSINGLPGNIFNGFDAARQRLDNHLRNLDDGNVVTPSATQPVPATDDTAAAGLHAVDDGYDEGSPIPDPVV